MSDRIDSLICPRWTVQVEPSCDAKRDLCLAVHDGRVVELLPRAQDDEKYAPDAVHERPEHVLLPGLINAHTHAAMTLLRGFADDMSLERWLNERIWPTEMRLASPGFVTDGTGLAIAEMLRGGITCFADMYLFPDMAAEVAAAAGIRAAVGMVALEFPTPWAQTPAEYISKGLLVHDAYKSHPLVTTTFAPHAPYSVSGDTLDVLTETQHLARKRPDLQDRAVFRMATEWGARALGIDAGTIEVGRFADLAAFTPGAGHQILGRDDARCVLAMVGGRVLFRAEQD